MAGIISLQCVKKLHKFSVKYLIKIGSTYSIHKKKNNKNYIQFIMKYP